jgi:hypothetical protein
MKVHTVKSNAKRAARKLCEQHPGLVPVEPLPAAKGSWFATVAASDGFDPATLPAGTFADVEFIAADGRVGAPTSKAVEGVTSAELATIDPVSPGFAAAVETKADDAIDVPAFLKRRLPEPEMARAETVTIIKTASMGKSEPSPLSKIEHMKRTPAAILAQPAAEKAAKVKTVTAVKALPPRQASTPEEIAARREERRQRMTEAKANPKPAPEKVAKATKADSIIELASRPEGATNAELQAVTGWQAHTLRGFIAGTLRKRGHEFRLAKRGDGSKAYHCGAPA